MELERVIAAADDRYRPLFAFAASTGARLGETLGLRWRSLDLDHGTASITHQLDRQSHYVELKTARSRRTVELPSSLESMLRTHKLESPYSGAGDYVFTSRDGGPLEHRNIGGRALRRALERAGLEEGEDAPTFHSLRHGFASGWIASGGDLVELSAHLGHRDPSITASTYSHEFEKVARSDARRARLDGMFASPLGSHLSPKQDEEGRDPSGAVIEFGRPRPCDSAPWTLTIEEPTALRGGLQIGPRPVGKVDARRSGTTRVCPACGLSTSGLPMLASTVGEPVA